MATVDDKVEKGSNNETCDFKWSFSEVFKTTEELEIAEEGRVIKGKVPGWLSGGKYLRIGPGKFDFTQGFTVNSFLDGLAVLSKFEFKDGQVLFTKRFLRTDAYKKALEAGKPVFPELHTPCSPDLTKTIFRRLIPSLVPEMSDNVVHGLFLIGSTLFASNETNNLWTLDPENLSVVKKYDSNKLLGLSQTSAHPIQDPLSKKLYMWGCTMTSTGGKCNILRIPPPSDTDFTTTTTTSSTGDDTATLKAIKQCENLASVSPWSLKLSSFIHTCGITQNYFVLVEQPFFTNLTKVVKSVAFGKTYCCSDWVESTLDQQVTNRFYIIDKVTGLNYGAKIQVFSEQAFIFSHLVNAFEDGDTIVIDVITYDDAKVFDKDTYDLNSLRQNGLFHLKSGGQGRRFILPKSIALDEAQFANAPEDANFVNNINKWPQAKAIKKDGKIWLTGQTYTDKAVEMPVISRNFVGKKYKFLYGTGGLLKNHAYQNSVFKVNVESRKVKVFRGEQCIFGEPCFVPHPSADGLVSEDLGVVLVAVNNLKDATNYLLLLDAKNFKEIVRISFHNHIPPALHGLFLSETLEK